MRYADLRVCRSRSNPRNPRPVPSTRRKLPTSRMTTPAPRTASMTTCAALRDRLPAFADGELDPGTVAVVEQHLAECAGCQASVARTQSLVRAVKRAERLVVAPTALRECVEAALEAARAAAAEAPQSSTEP